MVHGPIEGLHPLPLLCWMLRLLLLRLLSLLAQLQVFLPLPV